MKNDKLFENVKELNLPSGKYALFGSAPMCARNLKKCHDIDILVTEDLFDELRQKDGWNFKISPRGSEALEKGDIEIFKDWKPGEWDENKLIREAEIIDGLPFVKLNEVLKWKKLRGEDKDLKDAKIMEKYLQENSNQIY